MGSRTGRQDSGGRSTVSMDVGVGKWKGHQDHDIAKQECKGQNSGLHPRGSRTRPKEAPTLTSSESRKMPTDQRTQSHSQ